MHKDFAYLHPEFQITITGAILIQSLQNKDFINPKKQPIYTCIKFYTNHSNSSATKRWNLYFVSVGNSSPSSQPFCTSRDFNTSPESPERGEQLCEN